jgi:hypothetical protein
VWPSTAGGKASSSIGGTAFGDIYAAFASPWMIPDELALPVVQPGATIHCSGLAGLTVCC